MTRSSITTLRQQIVPDCHYRAVSGLVCAVPLYGLLLWPNRPHSAWQQHEKNLVAVLKWARRAAKGLALSSSTTRLITIAIVAPAIAHRSSVPAVSYPGACLTPA